MINHAIILAAGKGTRMKTELPKCAFPMLRKPMIDYIVGSVNKSIVNDVVLVVGHKRDVFFDLFEESLSYAIQEEQLGTGHAVKVTKEILGNENGNTIILLGDMPLVDDELINDVFNYHIDRKNDLTVVTTHLENPYSYGRVIRNEHGNIESIVEEKDASREQKRIQEVNTGIYIVDNKKLFESLEYITNDNTKGEYYLTDIVSIMRDKYVTGTYILKDSTKVMGINDLYSLSIAEGILRKKINKKHMLNGVSIINPDTVTIGHNVEIQENVIINPNTYITGNSKIFKGSIVGPNTEVHNSIIYEDVIVKHSLIYDSEVNRETTIGPFAHLRNGAVIGPRNRIGNFVEIKKSITGENTKASHLAYIGDTVCGSNVNFGCGSITVNYDGINKYQTTIGDDVFVGCNSNLIAPVVIEDRSFIAAGSTITENIPKDALAIARNYQVNKHGYAEKLRDGEKKKH